MKRILLLSLLLLPIVALAQYPTFSNKQKLGVQTTGDGLIFRGNLEVPNYIPSNVNNAYFYLDTVRNTLKFYKDYWIQIYPTPQFDTTTLNVYLKISDTTAMLLPYFRDSDTTSLNLINRFALKLNISDTATMLTPYMKKADTISLSNRINLKLNISDTTILSNRITTNANNIITINNKLATKLDTIYTKFKDVVTMIENKDTINIGSSLTDGYAINIIGDSVNIDTVILDVRYPDRDSTNELQDITFATTAGIVTISGGKVMNLDTLYNSVIDSVNLLIKDSIAAFTPLTEGYGINIIGDSINVDTTVIFTQSDTITLSNRIDLKLNTSDTITLSNRINTKLNASDTVSLSNRIDLKLNKTDTINLSDRIDLKLNKSDTISLSNRIDIKLNASDTVSLSNRINARLNISDTTNMLAPYLRESDTINLSNRINNKLDTIYVNYQTNVDVITNKDTINIIPLTEGFGINIIGDSINIDSTVILETQQKQIAYVKNMSGVTMYKGQAVYSSGSTGDNKLVELASSNTEQASSKTFGIVETDSIPNGGHGYVITFGVLSGFNTNALTEGLTVYLSNTPGQLTSVKPIAPLHMVTIGICIRQQQNNGSIFVKIQNGFEFDELHDVRITTPVDKASIYYNLSENLWRDTTATLLISDTASMLNPYLRKLDTISLSNRIDLRVKYADTTNMLLPYFKTNDTTLLNLNSRLSIKLNLSDTANMLSKYVNTYSNQIDINGNKTFNNVVTIDSATVTGKLLVNTNISDAVKINSNTNSTNLELMNNNGTVSIKSTNRNMVLQTDTTALMYLNGETNRVGILTMTPEQALQVAGTIRVDSLVNNLTPDKLVGANNANDLTDIKIGNGLSFSNDTLKVADNIINSGDTATLLRKDFLGINTNVLVWTEGNKKLLPYFTQVYRNGQLLKSESQYTITSDSIVTLEEGSYRLGDNITIIAIDNIVALAGSGSMITLQGDVIGSGTNSITTTIGANKVTNTMLAGSISNDKLNTITTAGKISNSATTATNSNTGNTIVSRDASGNFSAGIITASLNGNAATVTTNANLTGDITSIGNATSIATGVIVNADINASAAIAVSKLAASTISGVTLGNNLNTLTISSPLTGTSYNGSSAVTIGLQAATTSVAGSMSAADKTKLDGIAAGAQVNVPTNLAQGTRTTTTVPITSSTGTTATLDIATTSLAGVMSSADKAKLDGIASGATANTGTVTSVAALTLTTTGTDVSSSVATGTTTPVITLNIPNASSTNRGVLTSTDWNTFNNKQNALGFTPANSTITINTTSPLQGGGNLSANRTLSILSASDDQSGIVNTTAQLFSGNKVFKHRLTADSLFYLNNTSPIPTAILGIDLTGDVNSVGKFILGNGLSITSSTLLADTNLLVTRFDTASMLTPYFRDDDTTLLNLNSRFATKLNALDTASLSNRIDAKGTGTVQNIATGYGLTGGTITSTGTLLLDSAVVFSRIRDSIVDVAIGNDTIKILKQEYAPATTSVLTWTITPKFPIQLKQYILVFRNGQLLINDQYNLTDTNKITIVSNSFKVGSNYTVVTVSGIGSVGTGVFQNLIYPDAGIALSTGTTWASSIPNNSSNWNTAFTDRLKWDGGSTGLTPSTGRTSLGGTTIGQSMFTLTNPSTISFPRFNADNTVTALSAATFRSAIGAGTVTSVNVAAGTPMSITNNTTTPEISMVAATGSVNGYLASTDWTTFNNKQNALSNASASVSGILTSTDWTTFNNKENTITAGTTGQYFRGDKTFQTLDKSAVGLGNVDNTSDANKPISTATQTALNLKFNTADTSQLNLTSRFAGKLNYTDTSFLFTQSDTNQLNLTSRFALKANLASPTFTGTVSGITKSMVGLGDVDNTSDANKPVSTATQTALNLKVNISDTASMLTPYFRDADTSQLNLTSRFAAKQNTLNGTGFVKASGTTISYDNSSYLRTGLADSTYLKLTGGTLTGGLTVATTGVPFTVNSINSNINKITLSDNGIITSYLGASNTKLFTVANLSTTEFYSIDTNGVNNILGFGVPLNINSLNSNNNKIALYDNGSITGYIASNSSKPFVVNNNSTNEVFYVTESGNANFTGNITEAGNNVLTSADTTSMLMPYLRKADTTNMLSPYFRDADTSLLNLTSRFNTKQNTLVSGTNIKTVNSNSLLGSGNISVGTVTSVGGTGTVSGLTLTGSVTNSGNLTLGGTLSLTSSNVTTALGYTPYNSTNPNGYIRRTDLSFAAGSGNYDNINGVITIPTNNNQITNGAGYITSSSLSSYLPLSGGTLTGTLNGTKINLNAGLDVSGNFSTSYHANLSALFRGYQVLVAPNNDYGSTRIHFPNRPVSESFSEFGSGIRHKWAGSDARNSFLSLYTSNNSNLQIDAVSIDALGNVGIRDTTPSYTLDINGTLGVTSEATFSNTSRFIGNVAINTTTAYKPLEVYSNANDFVSVGVRNLGIGQFSGIHFGYVEPNTDYRKSAIVFQRRDYTGGYDASGSIHLLNVTQGQGGRNADLRDAKITIFNNGFVGINDTTPEYQLDVSGTLNATGAATLDSTLAVTGAVTLSTTTATPTSLLGKDGSNVVGTVTLGNTLNLTSGTLNVNNKITDINTSTYTILSTDYYIDNKNSSSTTIILPLAGLNTFRELKFKNSSTGSLIANGNIIPLSGSGTTTTILSATNAKWCTLVSDGTDWRIMQAN